MKYRILPLLVGIGILFSLIYFSDVSKISAAISKANPYILMAGVLVSFFLMIIRTLRWDVLLRRLSIETDFRKLFPVMMAGAFISNLTPAKTGEPARSYFLKKKLGVSFSKSLPSVIIERVFDIIILVIISIPFLFLKAETESFIGILNISVLLYLVVIIVIIYVFSSKSRIDFTLKKIYRIFYWFPKMKKLNGNMERVSINISQSFVKYKYFRITAITTLLSLLIWVLEGIILYLSFIALGLHADILVCVSILSISILISILTSLPGGIGSNEVIMVLLFTAFSPFEIAPITAAVLISRIVSMWLSVVVGGLSLGSLEPSERK